jgi:ppGpp synthetase/RelA/SpoT-type nucleotidyltranferase
VAEMNKLTPEAHAGQIEAYVKVRHAYVIYADALRRVLQEACRASFPEALIQARPKAVSSFAEKVARKFAKYPDAVNQMTDLCGARVIVQTAEQVRAVRGFIEANFVPLESDDKGLLLSNDEFGYRDMHYIVRLKPERAGVLGFTAEEQEAIGERTAEIQVRTWLQHAWADTLHDRIYKNKLKLSPDILRTGALLAALMEEGDRNFNVLADDLDRSIANYTAFATREDVLKEIDVQQLILGNEREEKKKPGLALKLARLLAAMGEDAKVVDLLMPFASSSSAGERCELVLGVGTSLCHLHREKPASAEYLEGKRFLEEAVRLCAGDELTFVPHLRNRESLHARALSRLGWAVAAIPGEEHHARRCVRLAHEHEPSNPYYLAGMLGFEMRFGPQGALPASMATTIREAVRTCRAHALAGIELPYSYFAAGRLSLLLEQGYDALGYYARGIRHCLAGVYCTPPEILTEEASWVRSIHFGVMPTPESQRVIDLLTLGRDAAGTRAAAGAARFSPPVLILAGGAESLALDLVQRIHVLLKGACGRFRGAIISGGTTSGLPGAIGDVAKELAAEGGKQFRLFSYRPARLPDGVSAHPNYDEHTKIGADFLPDQILRYWSDLLAAGVKPHEVLLLGFGGGALSALEYRIALALGASVAVVAGTGGEAASLLADPLWSSLPNLYELPFDTATVRAFVMPAERDLDPADQEEMAKTFHARYVAGSPKRLPPNMRPWDKLDATFKRANIEQAHYSVEILEAAGFEVRKADGAPAILSNFREAEVERMAELEHGRWNIERLRDGWRYSRQRDDSRKLHDCLVAWHDLPDDIKEYDREAVRAFPEILAKAGLEIARAGGLADRAVQ